MDPFTLIALGLGTGASLYGGIKNAVEAPKKKRQFLEEQQRQAQLTAARNSRMSDFYGDAPIDFWGDRAQAAADRKREVQKYADENFDVDPMSFVPFVQNATQLAGGLYDAGKSAPAPKSVTGPRSGVTMTQEEFFAPQGYETRGPSSGARLAVDDFIDPEELRYFGGRGGSW